MSDWTPDDIVKIVQNPFYAINIDPHLCAPHETMLPRETWIEANVKMIQEVGPRKWLASLLDVLEGGYITSDSGPAAFGFMQQPGAPKRRNQGEEQGRRKKKRPRDDS